MPRDPIQSVADELAIRGLIARYADATTRRDAQGVAHTFVADGVWAATGLGEVRGHAEMVPRFTELLAPFTAFLHALFSGCVDLDADDPDRATGRWYMMELGQMADGRHLNMWGVYHDVYVRSAEGWRISRRRFDRLFSRTGDGITAYPFPSDVPDPG